MGMPKAWKKWGAGIEDNATSPTPETYLAKGAPTVGSAALGISRASDAARDPRGRTLPRYNAAGAKELPDGAVEGNFLHFVKMIVEKPDACMIKFVEGVRECQETGLDRNVTQPSPRKPTRTLPAGDLQPL